MKCDDFIISQMVFVCYITHGRDKYEYHTELVGLFSEFYTAASALTAKLTEMGFLEAYDEQYQNMEVPRAPDDMDNDRLQNFLKKYENSYFDEGWSYTIVFKNIER
jgi:hypothetical protein